ncbi:MAG: response regulator transcription factor [Propionibacteriaceae bacterium]|nr:response regulator transcription factor [Propionibacteriaceae bacterium]
MNAAPLVLVVDDEPRMVSLLQLALEAAGYATCAASDESAAWRLLGESPVALVVLDVMLAGASGVDLCRRIRQHSDVPVILLTALGDAADRVAGLEAGADDYIAKPFSPRELVLRVGAIFRRTAERKPSPVTPTRRAVGDLVLDAALALAREGDRNLHLTPGEFKLLWLLSERPGRTVPLGVLMEALGHDDDGWGARAALRTAVYRLRSKLADAGAWEIRSEHGRGYRLVTGQPSGVTTITQS